jgi:hypothetical protein
MGGHGTTLCYFTPTFINWKPSVAVTDLLIEEEYCLFKRIYLRVDSKQKVQKMWLSQANHVMGKSGLASGKFLSTLISIIGLMI